MGTQRLTLAVVLVFGSAMVQGSTIDFNISPGAVPGRVFFEGGATPLVGADLGVASVTGTQTPLNLNRVLNITGGQLNFVTGNFTGTAGGQEWDFGPRGHVVLEGGIPALGIPSGTVLLSGQFADTTFVRPLSLAGYKVVGGDFLDMVNPVLAAYYGLPRGAVTYVGGLAGILTTLADPGSPFSSTGPTSAHLVTSPVPEPGMLALYATSLLGLSVCGRRWFRSWRAPRG
jgi:hypothetical protein